MTHTDTSRFSRERLEALLAGMGAQRIVVVGDAMLDIYLAGDADRLSPEAPVPVVTVHHRRSALGGAANVAANVAAIGAECRLVAVVGDDPRGDSFRSELASARLTDRHLVVTAARPTTSKTRVVARGQQVVRIDEEVDEPIPARAVEQVLAALERAMVDADALLMEDYNKGTLTPQVIERGLGLARRRGVPVVVDPKFKHFFAYKGATVFKPNRRELEQAMGAALDLDHPDALPSTLETLGVDNLLLTLGAAGMVLVTKDQEITRIPTMAREVFDVSGAGDTVTAWVGTALAAGASAREAARAANFAAGIEVGKAGVATVSPTEVLAVHEAFYDQLGKLRRGGLL
ncbi:MAG: D-glycero-beta-D-manno-heptose-7-phosphate kinase [Gemmatimonadetes bacterium]|nr:D-glycero-beta-D-manno-heptose-7-phosphate kinase [Gemmatimonadota bacterium]